MFTQQRDLSVPCDLVPRCPVCGAPMSMNLRVDDTFVEDAAGIRPQVTVRRFYAATRDSIFSFWNWASAAIHW